MQSLKITATLLNMHTFKAEKKKKYGEIPLDRLYSKLNDLFQVRKKNKKNLSLRKKGRSQRKSPTYHAVMPQS